MSLRTGSEGADFGEFPDEWNFVQLQTVISEAKNGFASGQRDERGIVQIRMNNVTADGRLTFDEYVKVPIPKDFDSYLLNPGDLLFNNTNSFELVGKSAIFEDAPFPCTFSNHFTRLRADRMKVLPEWILLLLQTQWRRGYFRTIAIRFVGQSSIHAEELLQLRIPLPPIQEQRGTIAIIATVENTLRKTAEIIAKTQRLKKGLAEILLTKGIGHAKYKQSEAGEIPENWRPARMKDIIVEPVRNGYSPISPSHETGKWILTLSAVSEHGFRPDKVKPAPLSDPKLDRCKLRQGDILVSRSNTRELVGLSGVYRDTLRDCYYPVLMMRVKVDRARIDGFFVDHWLRHSFSRRYISSRAQGTSGSMVKITGKILSELPIFLPELSEQRKIVGRLSILDEKIYTENRYKERLEGVKQALTCVLLAGKVRVKVNLNRSSNQTIESLDNLPSKGA